MSVEEREINKALFVFYYSTKLNRSFSFNAIDQQLRKSRNQNSDY